LAEKILETYGPRVSQLVLIPSKGGRFEVVAGENLLFSKAALGRHADPDEVLRAIESGQPITA